MPRSCKTEASPLTLLDLGYDRIECQLTVVDAVVVKEVMYVETVVEVLHSVLVTVYLDHVSWWLQTRLIKDSYP